MNRQSQQLVVASAVAFLTSGVITLAGLSAAQESMPPPPGGDGGMMQQPGGSYEYHPYEGTSPSYGTSQPYSGSSFQKDGADFQMDGANYQKDGFNFQKDGAGFQKDGFNFQKDGAGFHEGAGTFPGRGATQGTFQGQGATQGRFPGGGQGQQNPCPTRSNLGGSVIGNDPCAHSGFSENQKQRMFEKFDGQDMDFSGKSKMMQKSMQGASDGSVGGHGQAFFGGSQAKPSADISKLIDSVGDVESGELPEAVLAKVEQAVAKLLKACDKMLKDATKLETKVLKDDEITSKEEKLIVKAGRKAEELGSRLDALEEVFGGDYELPDALVEKYETAQANADKAIEVLGGLYEEAKG